MFLLFTSALSAFAVTIRKGQLTIMKGSELPDGLDLSNLSPGDQYEVVGPDGETLTPEQINQLLSQGAIPEYQPVAAVGEEGEDDYHVDADNKTPEAPTTITTTTVAPTDDAAAEEGEEAEEAAPETIETSTQKADEGEDGANETTTENQEEVIVFQPETQNTDVDAEEQPVQVVFNSGDTAVDHSADDDDNENRDDNGNQILMPTVVIGEQDNNDYDQKRDRRDHHDHGHDYDEDCDEDEQDDEDENKDVNIVDIISKIGVDLGIDVGVFNTDVDYDDDCYEDEQDNEDEECEEDQEEEDEDCEDEKHHYDNDHKGDCQDQCTLNANGVKVEVSIDEDGVIEIDIAKTHQTFILSPGDDGYSGVVKRRNSGGYHDNNDDSHHHVRRGRRDDDKRDSRVAYVNEANDDEYKEQQQKSGTQMDLGNLANKFLNNVGTATTTTADDEGAQPTSILEGLPITIEKN